MRKQLNASYKKIALVLSLCALIVWGFLGAGTSLAWFADTSPEINNIFHFANFDLDVYHQLTNGSWIEVTDQTELFDKNARYEPGYVQVVYLRVDNNSDCDFLFQTAVNVNGYDPAINVFGQTFKLQDHLRFGITISATPEEMKNSVATRALAAEVAQVRPHNYDPKATPLKAGKSAYVALVLRMPEEVTNIANHQGDKFPTVELGITVRADQIRNP